MKTDGRDLRKRMWTVAFWLVCLVACAMAVAGATTYVAIRCGWAQHLDAFSRMFTAVATMVGAVGVFFALASLTVNARSHLLGAYDKVFELLDTAEMRAARHFVAGLPTSHPPGTPATDVIYQRWASYGYHSPPAAATALAVSPGTAGTDYQDWRHAENVFRAFDKLGFLVREGRIPIDIIARFYVVPIVQAWLDLWPYLKVKRKKKEQPSHGWEFENLVYGIILPRVFAPRPESMWADVASHDAKLTQLRKEANLIYDAPANKALFSHGTRSAQLWQWDGSVQHELQEWVDVFR